MTRGLQISVGQHDGDALQAEQRLLRNQDAMEILIGLLAPLIGMLPDRYFQFTRHLFGAKALGKGLMASPLSRVRPRKVNRDQAIMRFGAAWMWVVVTRFGAVLMWVAYSVNPVKERPPTRLPTTVGISFQIR